MSTDSANLLSPSTLAFVGDAVYSLLVRTYLAGVNRPAGELHRLSVEMVNANAQAEAAALLLPQLSEREAAVFRRGRNLHVSAVPKSSDGGKYHAATGLETLFGYLWLSKNRARAEELFSFVLSSSLAGVEPRQTTLDLE